MELRGSASVADRVQEWEALGGPTDGSGDGTGAMTRLALGEETGPAWPPGLPSPSPVPLDAGTEAAEDIWLELGEEGDIDDQDRELLLELRARGFGSEVAPSFATAGPGSDGSRRCQEVVWKKLSPEEREEFRKADATEWSAMTATKAARVVPPLEAALVRRRDPSRILSSRMVRRWKPQEGTGVGAKPKSRWCVRGYADPDAESLHVYAPTPRRKPYLSPSSS